MKKLSASVVMAFAVIVLMSGCAGISYVQGGVGGSLYNQTEAGVAVGSAAGSDKTGTSKSTSIIGIATGDSSIQTAMQNGGITKIHHVDCKVMSVLGVYATYTTVVYGE